MIPRLALPTLLHAATLAAAALTTVAPVASAMDISGIVINKSDQPVPLAQVCFKNNPSRCAATSIGGTFRIADNSSVRARGPSGGYALELRGERLALMAPSPVDASVAWLDPSGRVLAPVRTLRLGSTPALLAVPGGAGMRILHVTAPDLSLTWKVLSMGAPLVGSSRAEAQLRAPIATFLGKAAAISELQVSKTGFRTELYLPFAEVENDAVILLTALSDSGFVFTSTYKAKNTLDKVKGSMITEATFDTCKGTVPDPVTVKDTMQYAVRDGKLLTWYPGQCRAEAATGTSTDVVGAWTMTQSDVFLPQDLRPAACRDTVPSSSLPPTIKALLNIGETEQSFQIASEVCPPDMYLALISFYLLSDTTVELTKNTCRALTFTNGKGEEATLNFARRGPDSLASAFAYKTATCAGVENMRQGEGIAIDCSGNDPVFNLLECIAGTQFFGPLGPPPKRAAASGIPAVLPLRSLPGLKVPGTTGLARAADPAWTPKTWKALGGRF